MKMHHPPAAHCFQDPSGLRLKDDGDSMFDNGQWCTRRSGRVSPRHGRRPQAVVRLAEAFWGVPSEIEQQTLGLLDNHLRSVVMEFTSRFLKNKRVEAAE